MTDTNNAQMTPQQQAAMDQIREKVLEYLGIQYAPKEKQDEVLAKLGETSVQKILIALLERLDSAGQIEYDALLERGASPEEMDAFLRERVPDYEEVVKKTMDDLMERLVSAGNAA